MKEFLYNQKFTESCHSSTIELLPNGDLFATWFAGSAEGESDVGIYGATKDKDFGWSEPVLIAKVDNEPHWNPVVSHYGGRLNLFFKVGPSPRDWSTWLMTSKYNAEAWTSPRKCIFGPVKNKPILMSNGEMLAGTSLETDHQWRSFTTTYTANNAIIRNVEIPRPKGVGMIQPTLWETQDGHIHALMRTTVGVIYRSGSVDYGKSWYTAYPTNLPNNNSGIDVVYNKKLNILFLVFNPIWSPGISAKRRGSLIIVFSQDNGETWHDEAIPMELEYMGGEYSYPAIIFDGEYLHTTYTWNRKDIVYQRIRV